MHRRTRLLEALEDRRYLSAAPSPLEPSASGTWAEVGALVSESLDSGAAPGTITLFRHGAPLTAYEPSEDTDTARGIALRTALAEAQPWDELFLDAATYDMGNLEHVEFPARVTVVGAGKYLTRITSSVPQGADGAATFTLNNLSTIEDCWLEGSLADGSYQPLVGMQGTPTENVTTYLRRVKITGDSDGIFVWTNQLFEYSLYGYDLEISTRFDAVALLGSGSYPQTVKLYDSTITVAQPSSIPAHSSNAVNVRSGFVGLYNCTVNVTGDAETVQTVGIWCYNLGSAEVVDCTFNVSAPAGIVYDFRIQDGTTVTVIGGQGSGPGGSYTSSSGTEVYQAAQPTSVVGRSIFYNNSAYDDSNPRAGVLDAGAEATDKFPLLPQSGLAEFSAVSSYSRGINGLVISLTDFYGMLTADDFQFRVGNSHDLAGWTPAPAPTSVTMFAGADAVLPPYVELIWQDGAIANTWLEVTVLPTAATGLSAPYVFYFGSLIGDTGNPTANLFVTNVTGDVLTISADIGPSEGIEDPADIDRSGVVTASNDRTLAIANLGGIVRLDLSPDSDLLNAGDGGDGAIASAVTALSSSTPARERRDNSASGPPRLAAAIAAFFSTLGDDPTRWLAAAPVFEEFEAAQIGPDDLEILLADLARAH
jgi:hypothetical protein